MSVRFTVPGIPIAQPRQRHRIASVRAAGQQFVQNFTPAKDPVNAYKAAVSMVAQQHFTAPLDGPVELMVTFILPRPKSMMWKRLPTPRERHAKKPDLENIVKSLQDALTGLAYRDDSQVCVLRVEKWIAAGDEMAGTVVEISSLGNLEPVMPPDATRRGEIEGSDLFERTGS